MNNIEVFIYHNNKPTQDINPIVNIFNATPDINGKSQIITIKTVNIETFSGDNLDQDYLNFQHAISNSDPNNYIIICKDDIISNHSPNILLKHLDTIITNQYSSNMYAFDICYVCHWMSDCDKLYNSRVQDGLIIENTPSSNGLSCIMLSPNGRKKFNNIFGHSNPVYKGGKSLGILLRNNIAKTDNDIANNNSSKFIGILTKTELISPDPTKFTSNTDYIKTQKCKPPALLNPPSNSTIIEQPQPQQPQSQSQSQQIDFQTPLTEEQQEQLNNQMNNIQPNQNKVIINNTGYIVFWVIIGIFLLLVIIWLIWMFCYVGTTIPKETLTSSSTVNYTESYNKGYNKGYNIGYNSGYRESKLIS